MTYSVSDSILERILLEDIHYIDITTSVLGISGERGGL